MVWVRVVAVLLLVPAALAQTQLFVDDEGDVRASSSDGRVGLVVMRDQWPNVDIRAGGIWAETDDVLTFYLNVTRLEPEQDPPLPKSQPRYFFHFRYGEQGYRLQGQTDLGTPFSGALGRPAKTAALEIEYQEGVYHHLADAELVLDFEGDRILWNVDRAHIRDHNAAPLGRGDWLWDFHARSRAMGWFGIPILLGDGFRFEVGPPAFSDEAPGGRLRGDPYQMASGRQLHKGNLLAASYEPVRWTNGEATTFVYYIQLFNSGDRELEAFLGHEGADARWQVAFSDSLKVPPKDSINITYHVAIPFGHNHGKLHEFDATFKTADGQHWARQPLAVYWPAIPQPAGHHPEVWLHSRVQPREPPFETLGDRVHGWWSATDDEPYDEQLPIAADRIHAPAADLRSRAEWTMRLEPSLRMGLDFILDQVGQGTIHMQFPFQVQDPELQLELVHMDRRTIIPKQVVLMRSSASHVGAVQGPAEFALDLVPLEAADLIRHHPRAELEFRINLTGVFPGHGFENPEEATPTILPQGSMLVLPLREYHDPLDTVFSTHASATITVGPEGQEKKVNPGKQALFTFLLHYTGTFESRFGIELSGVNVGWARVVGDPVFLMEPGDTREVAVAVQPPLGAVPGEYAELTVKAVGSVNAAVQAGMVVRAEVVSQEVDDEAEQVLAKQEALSTPPGGGSMWWLLWLVPVLALGGVGLWFWRR